MSSAPLCLYVLWHPECADGPELARAVYNWFHAPSQELHRAGLGLPVYYRFEPWSDTAGAPPREIDLSEATINVIVALVDENMVAAPEWRAYLDDFARQDETMIALYPVALHPSAYRLPRIQRVNYLRVDAAKEPREGRLRRRSVRLRRQLTEVVSRHLHAYLARSDQDKWDPANAPPLTVFLSHAKKDGVAVAEYLRDEIFGYGQIKAFYDENDLPIGAGFEQVLKEAAEGQATTGMLCVVTDAYASRPWCRAEVSLARKPRQEKDPANPERRLGRWFIQPVVAVDALQGNRTRGIPELGNAPILRWHEGAATETLDLLMLESLLFAFHRLSARSIPEKKRRHVISWVPDPSTLFELSYRLRGHADEIVYPGHGLPKAERKAYERYLDPIKLKTFEEVRE